MHALTRAESHLAAKQLRRPSALLPQPLMLHVYPLYSQLSFLKATVLPNVGLLPSKPVSQQIPIPKTAFTASALLPLEEAPPENVSKIRSTWRLPKLRLDISEVADKIKISEFQSKQLDR